MTFTHTRCPFIHRIRDADKINKQKKQINTILSSEDPLYVIHDYVYWHTEGKQSTCAFYLAVLFISLIPLLCASKPITSVPLPLLQIQHICAHSEYSLLTACVLQRNTCSQIHRHISKYLTGVSHLWEVCTNKHENFYHLSCAIASTAKKKTNGTLKHLTKRYQHPGKNALYLTITVFWLWHCTVSILYCRTLHVQFI
jgi:hypothetical protein